MTSCAQFVDIEELVTGELVPSHAARLRAHASECSECAAELRLATAERELFARRAAAVEPPPPALAFALRERLASEASGDPSSRRTAQVRSMVRRFVRRGHVSAACAAALFVVAAFSRLGTGTMTVTAQVSGAADGELASSGMLASFGAAEPLACSTVGFAALATSRDEGASSSSLASMQEARACAVPASRTHDGCEPFVTCSALRQ